jgi:cell division protein FtsA
VDVVRNPIHATGVGLLLYGLQNMQQRQSDAPMTGGLKEVWGRMKAWFQGNF